jgi:hypothetical protein
MNGVVATCYDLLLVFDVGEQNGLAVERLPG